MPDDAATLVAIVMLRPRSGRSIGGDQPITAENLTDYLPDPQQADGVQRALVEAGFVVGPLVGVGMAISGPQALFESYFGTRVAAAADGGWVAVDLGGGQDRTLPLNVVDPDVGRYLHAVEFESPVEHTDESAW